MYKWLVCTQITTCIAKNQATWYHVTKRRPQSAEGLVQNKHCEQK
jgi:hypothetical protein